MSMKTNGISLMMQLALYLSIPVMLTSCTDTTQQQEPPPVDTPVVVGAVKQVDTVPEAALWANAPIEKYLDENKDRLKSVEGANVSYMKEISEREGKTYAMVRIGHDFEDHYVTEQWIYVDSITKQVYEYDLPNDSLILWNGSNDRK